MGAALALGWKAVGGVLGFLTRIPPLGWVFIVVIGWGLWNAHQARTTREAAATAALQAQADKAHASEQRRQAERALSLKTQELSDAHQQATEARHRAADATRARLRAAADAERATAALAAATAACRSYAGPAVDVIPAATRDALVDIAADADQVADQLRTCQAYVREVLRGGPR